jgi:hypothetical protein
MSAALSVCLSVRTHYQGLHSEQPLKHKPQLILWESLGQPHLPLYTTDEIILTAYLVKC